MKFKISRACRWCNGTGIMLNSNHCYELCDCVSDHITKLEDENVGLEKKLADKAPVYRERSSWENNTLGCCFCGQLTCRGNCFK